MQQSMQIINYKHLQIPNQIRARAAKLHMHIMHDDTDFQIYLPNPTVELSQIFSQLKLFSKQRLDNDDNQDGQLSQSEIKGLKFISAKLAKLFFKNRKLPYNQISKILIDNFASEQKDERNIKRRVYDAINVLVAAGILVKKNNSIEMIKNKVRPKTQPLKKDKIQELIKEKQETLLSKKNRHFTLINKHKLIKKLFDRNIRSSSLKETKKLKKSRIHNNQSLKQSQSRALVQSSFGNIWQQSLIYQPRVLIFTSQNMSSKKVQDSILRNFETTDQIQMIVPYKKRHQPILLQSHGHLRNKDWMVQMNQEINENEIKQEDYVLEDDVQVNQLITKYGVYSLLDLLELLSLNQIEEQ